jgi:hypothetical protein
MSSAPTLAPEEIAGDAKWLAQALDPSAGMVRLIAMNLDSYRAASFLDDRLLRQPIDAQILPWPEVEAAVSADLRSDARWIFHIGHVGSTLISRLLGEIEGVLAIREPRLLRDLAISPANVRACYMPPVPKLMSRTFAADEIACVKATSFASEIAAELVPTGERALFMFATPRNYVASILAGENSLNEAATLAESRAQRLASRGITLAPVRTDADRAAAAWACEMTALEAAAWAMSDRYIEWADFDLMLADIPGEIARAARFFGFDADQRRIDAIASGPLMQRYSKALEYEYSPTLRTELITDAARRHGSEIDTALAMLRAAAEESDLLARALARAEG